jgi:hypothetical protein
MLCDQLVRDLTEAAERTATHRRPDKVLMALKLQQRLDGAIDEYDVF